MGARLEDTERDEEFETGKGRGADKRLLADGVREFEGPGDIDKVCSSLVATPAPSLISIVKLDPEMGVESRAGGTSEEEGIVAEKETSLDRTLLLECSI